MSQKPTPQQEPITYCNLLHIPLEPYMHPAAKPFLGIYLSSKEIESIIYPSCEDNTFIQVGGVIDGTAAMEAGLQKDDVILSINDQPTCKDKTNVSMSFKDLIGQLGIGSTINMNILRDEERISLTAELKKRPSYRQDEANHPYFEECQDSPSRLEMKLHELETLPVFYGIMTGLNEQSDTIHNINWFDKERFNPFQLKEFTYMMRHPLGAGAVTRELSENFIELTDKKEWQMEDMIKRAAYLIDIELSHSYESVNEVTFPGLINAVQETKDRVEKALINLTEEEKTFLYEKALHQWDDEEWETILETSLKIDLKGLIEAFSPLLSFLKSDNLSLLKKDIEKRFGNSEVPILFEDNTPFGKIIVGGSESNTYIDDTAIILDIGGNDLYLNNAGGTRAGMPISLVIDWEGDDRYINKENVSQGAGVMGGGFLFDLSGNDTFSSLDGTQGAGFFGIGILYNQGGDSIYKSRRLSQGAGQMGIGLIWNKDGDNLYVCSEEGQAIGFFSGAGILIDEKGDDFYQLGGIEPDFREPLISTVSMGQGFGLGIRPKDGAKGVSGGIGIMIDKRGSDSYFADYFAQGASYYYGVGILNDLSGNDQYISGRYAQGAGIHSSVGVLMDHKGDDFYYTSFGVAQGMGHDYGIGYLEDTVGNDIYQGGILSQGSATIGGLGIIIDSYGKDSYKSSNNSQAFASDEECIGIMIDTESENDFISNHKNPESVRVGVKNTLQNP